MSSWKDKQSAAKQHHFNRNWNTTVWRTVSQPISESRGFQSQFQCCPKARKAPTVSLKLRNLEIACSKFPLVCPYFRNFLLFFFLMMPPWNLRPMHRQLPEDTHEDTVLSFCDNPCGLWSTCLDEENSCSRQDLFRTSIGQVFWTLQKTAI